MASIGHQGPDSVDIPKVMLVPKGHIQIALVMGRAIQRFTRLGLGIAFICQLTVTVDGVVTAALQFGCDWGLAAAGNAFDHGGRKGRTKRVGVAAICEPLKRITPPKRRGWRRGYL